MDDGVGKALHEARRQRGIDLAEVEATTRIRARFLRALENEEWDALPGEAYARAFIRTYGDYLGLDGAGLAEAHRREVGTSRPGEELLGVDPALAPVREPRRRRLAPGALAALVAVALAAILVVVAFTGREDGPAGTPEHLQRQHADSRQRQVSPPRAKPGLSLSLSATAEVWVCLLDAGGEALVDGQILAGGEEAGPFRSGSFTVSFGNGEVSMTVNGQQASIPATSGPIGYSIGVEGALRELPEGERPTCT
jgi:cytoskeleton protein RodZ